MVVLARNELSLFRERWRGRFDYLSQEDRTKVAGLLAYSLPVNSMTKEAIWRTLIRPAAGAVGRFFFGSPLRTAVRPAMRAAAPAAGAAAESALGAASIPAPPGMAGLRAYGAVAPEATTAAGAAAGAGAKLPGYLGRIEESWRGMGQPGPWMTKYLGGLARPAAKGMQYLMFPVGPGLSLYHGLTGEQGPVSTIANIAGPLATLPLGMGPMAAEVLASWFLAPKVDEWLGWKPRSQSEIEMFTAGAQQGAQQALASMPAPMVSPQQGQMPPPGSFLGQDVQSMMPFTPVGAMQAEQYGRALRGEM